MKYQQNAAYTVISTLIKDICYKTYNDGKWSRVS